jgi:UDP-N-acetylmuramyl-tripeptide synthetase
MPIPVLTRLSDVAQWLRARTARELVPDHRAVQPGDAFLAWHGAHRDAREKVATALATGAVACVVEREGMEAFEAAWAGLQDRIVAVSQLRLVAGELASQFYNEPSHSLRVVAITGTNGKTSTAWWTAQWLSAADCPAAMVGTLGIGRPGAALATTGLTTPDAITLQKHLRRQLDLGARAAVLEASSIGLEEARMTGCRVQTAVFTNLSQDHLDYHGSMEAYWAAKKKLFAWPGLQAAVVNIDDPYGAALATELQHNLVAGVDVWTVSCRQVARLMVGRTEPTAEGLHFEVLEDELGAGRRAQMFHLPFMGQYNLYNLLCALAVLRAHGISMDDAARTSGLLTAVPGRLQTVEGAAPGLPRVLVDYAHTPDALDKALGALRTVAALRGGQLVCVVGCGGDRDAGKRPQMAAVAEAAADVVVLTSDNPRSEDPLAILAQMQAGLSQPAAAHVIPDRAAAILQAIVQAGPHDVVLLAGKGHEDYQEVGGVRHPFSDAQQASAALRQRLAAQQGGRA